MIDVARAAFAQRFGADAPFVARAPGRVNLIGEHTDYNDGFVLPAAIDRGVWIAFRPRDDLRVAGHSLDRGATADFGLPADPADHGGGWGEYVRGVAHALADDGLTLAGWEGVIASDLPIGAGLSSSAALELAVARVFTTLAGVPWDPRRMARIAQRAENAWVGVRCGIMDQLASAAGRADHALLIDCRSFDVRPVAVPRHASIMVLDTTTRRGLVDSEYNARRAQCETAARLLGVSALRDADLSMLDGHRNALDPLTYRRARHVVTENARTLACAAALEGDDLERAGRLMNESHESLRDDFEVSRAELDVIARLARAHDACFGARMTGAGFGGCAVALVHADLAEPFARDVAAAYLAETGLTPLIHPCRAADGATVTSVGASVPR